MYRISSILLTAFFAATIPASSAGDLQRTITQPFPENFPACKIKRELQLNDPAHPPVIIAAAGDTEQREARMIQQRLEQAWGKSIPILSDEDGAAAIAGKTLILYGDCRANLPVRRLAALFRIEPRTLQAELRVMPDVPDWAGAIYIAGPTPEKRAQMLELLLQKSPQGAPLPAFGFLEGVDRDAPIPEEFARMPDALRQYYDVPPNSNPNAMTINIFFRRLADQYRRTGRDEYAKLFAECQKIYFDRYEGSLDARKTPPNFPFFQFPWFVDVVSDSPAFTDADRRLSAEIIRYVMEHCLRDKDLSMPLKNYAENRIVYYTNHPVFSARTLYFGAEYLRRHYHFKPADFWIDLAEKTLDGVLPFPLGPEDATAYQCLSYRNVLNYLIASGKMTPDFFRSPGFQQYIRYLKANYHHLGYTAGYGDSIPLFNVGTTPMLLYAADFLGDEEAEYIAAAARRTTRDPFRLAEMDDYPLEPRTDLPRPRSFAGLEIFPMDDFRLDYNHCANLFQRPTLDKAIFRTSWNDDSDFLVLSGVSAAPHGHLDANAISQYLRGSHVWLVEGDYCRRYPDETNSITVARNSELAFPDSFRERQLSRFSQILGSAVAPGNRVGALSLLLEQYNGTDWRRDVGWISHDGFWVIDTVTAREPGHYRMDALFRILGDMEAQNPQNFIFRQQPSGVNGDPDCFSVTEGTGALRIPHTQYDSSSFMAKSGSYRDYPLSSPLLRVIRSVKAGELKTGERFRMVHFFHPGSRESVEKAVIRPLGADAWIADAAGRPLLAVAGTLRSGDADIAAEQLFAAADGIAGVGVTRLHLGDLHLNFNQPQTVRLPGTPELAEALKTLAARAGAPIPAAAPAKSSLPHRNAVRSSLPDRIRALATAPDGTLGIGMENGSFRVLGPDGKLRFEQQLPAAVTAICAFVFPDRSIGWAVGAMQEDAEGNARLRFFDNDGKLQWEFPLPAFHGRNGPARQIFTARLQADTGDADSLIVAGEGAFFYAIDPTTGKLRWKHHIVHSNTVGSAADLDGDGRDEIIAGNEYYWHRLLDDDGKRLIQQVGVSPWTYCAAAADLDGDGKLDGLSGRSDNCIYVMTPPNGSRISWERINVGARPIAIVPVNSPEKAKFAVGTATGEIHWFDGDGKRVKLLRLAAPLRRMCADGDRLLALVDSGELYWIAPDGTPEAVADYERDMRAAFTPDIVVSTSGIAFASGKNLYQLPRKEQP